MRIRAKQPFPSAIDLSTLERLKEKNPIEAIPFKLLMKPGQVVDVDDQFRFIHNIQAAIRQGYIEIITEEILRIHVGTTPPSYPQVNDLWVDIS